MRITLTHAGTDHDVEVPLGSTAGIVRRLQDDLEEVGAPSTFTLSVNGEAASDETVLSPGARVAFRPVSGEKG
jgi:hypothetical protein